MINRRQCLKLLQTPFFSFLCLLTKGEKNWIKASRSIPEGPKSRKNFQCVSSLLVRLVSSAFPVCLFQVGQTSLCNWSDWFVSFRTLVCNISLPSSLDLRKYCNVCRKSGRLDWFQELVRPVLCCFRSFFILLCVISCHMHHVYLYDTLTLVSTPQIERYMGNSMILIEYVQMACLGHF
jgi:hypothetical protein